MAEQWEHMAVRAFYDKTRTTDLYTITAPEYRRSGRDVDSSVVDRDQGLELVNKLGREGWQLVSTEVVPTQSDDTVRMYWLKRRVEATGGGGWVQTP